jgi:hypothetical protein
MFAFAEALVVSNIASGRPRLRPLQHTLQPLARFATSSARGGSSS